MVIIAAATAGVAGIHRPGLAATPGAGQYDGACAWLDPHGAGACDHQAHRSTRDVPLRRRTLMQFRHHVPHFDKRSGGRW